MPDTCDHCDAEDCERRDCRIAEDLRREAERDDNEGEEAMCRPSP